MSQASQTKGELLRQYLEDKGVRLRDRSGYQKISCYGPGHSRGDRNPSASVNLTTGRYKCFTCGLAGDVYDLYQAEHGVDFKVAYAILGGALSPTESEPVWL